MTKNNYSPLSIFLALLLTITFGTFINFVADDIVISAIGEEPEYIYEFPEPKRVIEGEGVLVEHGDTKWNKFQKEELGVFQAKELIIKAFVFTSLFLIATTVRSKKIFKKSSSNLVATSFFVATIFGLFIVFTRAADHLYRLNQRLAVYLISAVTIGVFTYAIGYIQKLHHKK